MMRLNAATPISTSAPFLRGIGDHIEIFVSFLLYFPSQLGFSFASQFLIGPKSPSPPPTGMIVRTKLQCTIHKLQTLVAGMPSRAIPNGPEPGGDMGALHEKIAKSQILRA